MDRCVFSDDPVAFDQVHGDLLNLVLQIGGVIQGGLLGDHPQMLLKTFHGNYSKVQ